MSAIARTLTVSMLWDVFCQVIDNHGDVGVCWRLASQLAARGHRVRLHIDDASALRWMAPAGSAGVDVRHWSEHDHEPGDVVVEAFGCELPDAFQRAIAQAARTRPRQPSWINLEYLTAESFAQRNHGLPSPVLVGPAAGCVKHFFYPGFTPGTGGLLREHDLTERRAAFDRIAWLRQWGVDAASAAVVSLFCYEPPLLRDLLARWSTGPRTTHLLVTSGRAAQAVREAIAGVQGESLRITWLPLLTQEAFDQLLWACDLNFVRGEDSLVRALWAGRPFVWQLYPQHDHAHHAKLEAFLEWLEAPTDWREVHRAWNGMRDTLPALEQTSWIDCAAHALDRLEAQDDLVTQLVRFVGASAARTPMTAAGH